MFVIIFIDGKAINIKSKGVEPYINITQKCNLDWSMFVLYHKQIVIVN